MIETKERYDRLWPPEGDPDAKPFWNKSEHIAALETIEALRPFYRMVRETLILKVASAIVCGECAESWLDEQDEHHEEGCILYGMPEWLAE